uniref:PDZ domain-containing protein n=1 Tax=Ascaris lumbricoides TaxID=6252 RepID=A0A0M3IJL6_ASCLU
MITSPGFIEISLFFQFLCSKFPQKFQLTGDWTQVQMISIANEPGVGLGFGIVGGTSTGVVVKTILPGSPADKDKRLKPGDHILRIGSISVHGMGSQQVASLLRQQDTRVDLVVGRPLPHNATPIDTNGMSLCYSSFLFPRMKLNHNDK